MLQKKESLHEIKWRKMFGELVKFKEKNGHTQAKRTDIENATLSKWVRTQRYFYSKNILSQKRIEELNKIGFI